MSTTSSNRDYSQHTRARDWLKQLNQAARSAIMPTERVLTEVTRLANGGWTPAALAGYLHAADPRLSAGGIAATLEVIPDQPAKPTAPNSGPKPKRHHGVVTDNRDIDADELPWLVTCVTCIERAVYAAGRRGADTGRDHTGEWKVSDKTAAHQIAREHDQLVQP